jgi:hypothetical protein
MIIRMRPVRSVAAIVGPISLLFVPKCPLCILPLLAALGIAAPPGIVINSLVAALLLGWAIVLFTATSSAALRASGLVPAAILIAGRALAFAPATYLAGAVMIIIGFVVSRRCRDRACEKKGEGCPLQPNVAAHCSDVRPITSASPPPPYPRPSSTLSVP